MVAGFMALLVVAYFRDSCSYLADVSGHRKEERVEKPSRFLGMLAYGALSSSWAIGASAMAVPLSA
jgi:hypothetical protein